MGENIHIPVALHLHGPWDRFLPLPWKHRGSWDSFNIESGVYNAWECVGTRCACKHLVCMYSSHVCHQLVLLAPMCVLLAQVTTRTFFLGQAP